MRIVHFFSRAHLRKLNWPLFIGGVLILFTTFISIWGPSLAPQDPMQQNFALSVDGFIRTPPYPPFKVEGYPLGTDRWGRDLWSRILWGVRPTMIMVITVAGFRLVMGILLGLIIGWAEGRRARWMDSVLSSLLSTPVLIVALIGIYAVGMDRGLWAFIFGLGLTGWAETARMVSEQTRLIKRQTFVEAARALGASGNLILFNHILRQIMSLVWVLVSFEISSTLLVAASLGFLGIYIGGGIWIEVFDFQSVNVAGLPELGEMLSSSLVRITDPSALLVIGTFIFLGVLGFNLLGEGLRIELTQKEFGRRVGLMPQQASEWLNERVFVPLRFWMEEHGSKAIAVVAVAVVLAGAWMYYDRNQHLFASSDVKIEIPGDHLWAAEYRDPFGTLWTPYSMRTQPELKWQAQIPGGPSGGPVIFSDGMVIVAGRAGVLLAFSPQGEKLWEAALDAQPVGVPALDAQNRIYVADIEGHVTAFDTQGNRLWNVEASATRQATSGPIVNSQGYIYLTLIDAVVCISPDGLLVWRVTASDVYAETPPRLSADETLVYLKDAALDAFTGRKQEIEVRPRFDVLYSEPGFVTGADGFNYYRAGHESMRWELDDSGLKVYPSVTWKYGSFVLFNPRDSGVTPNGLTWFIYGSDFSDGRMVWLNRQSRLVGNYAFTYRNSRLMAVGEDAEAYLCGPTGARLLCVMTMPGANEPIWSVSVEDRARPIGGALIPDTLYVSTFDIPSQSGMLHALSTDGTQP
jgi:ABC-type dipeptide/oligopeptide/nickel transport system permease subunit